jgi:hypothetical protein
MRVAGNGAGGGTGGGARQGGMAMPEVTPQQCEAVRATLAKSPAAAKRLDDIRARLRGGELDRAAAMSQSGAIYDSLKLDGRVALGCRMQEMRGGAGGAAMRTAGAPGGPGGPGGQPAGGMGGGMGGGRGRTGLVFVPEGGSFTPKIVRLGASNYDYSEVTSGLAEGDQVALLAAATLQAQRQQSVERFRGMTGGGVPGMSRQQSQQGGATGGAAGGGRPPARP